jgi:hypothetical protein
MQNINLVPAGVPGRLPIPEAHSYLSSILAINAIGFVEDKLNHECYNLVSDLTLVFERYSGIDQRLAAARDLADSVALGAPTFARASKPATMAQLLKLLRFRADGIARQQAPPDLAAVAARSADDVYRLVWATYSLRQNVPALDTTTPYQFIFTPQKQTTVGTTLSSLDVNRCLGDLPIQLADRDQSGNWLGSNFINYCFSLFEDHTPDDVDFRSSDWMEFALRGHVPRVKPLSRHKTTLVPLNTPIPPIGQPFGQQPGGSLPGSHWTCLEIDHQTKTFTIHDSLFGPKAAQNTRVATTLGRVLGGRWTHLPLDFPLTQRNGSDCGVYTIINAWLIGCIGRTLTATEFMVDTAMWRALLATMALGAEDATKREPSSRDAPAPPTPKASGPPGLGPGPRTVQTTRQVEPVQDIQRSRETRTKRREGLQLTTPTRQGRGWESWSDGWQGPVPGRRDTEKGLKRPSASRPGGLAKSARATFPGSRRAGASSRTPIDLVDSDEEDTAERVVASRDGGMEREGQIAQDAILG